MIAPVWVRRIQSDSVSERPTAILRLHLTRMAPLRGPIAEPGSAFACAWDVGLAVLAGIARMFPTLSGAIPYLADKALVSRSHARSSPPPILSHTQEELNMHQKIQHEPTILRRRHVEHRTGLSRSTLYEYMKDGAFPKPVLMFNNEIIGRNMGR